MANQKQSWLKDQTTATSSWQLVAPSFKLAVKNYEQIAILFFIPSLISILGDFYLGNTFATRQFWHELTGGKLSGRQLAGIYLLLAWLIVSIVNYAPSIYFRLQAARKETAPSVVDCYRQGFKVFSKVWLSELASVFLTLIGLIALIVPGVLLFRRFTLAPYYAAENPKLSVKEILSKSAKQTNRYVMYVYSTFLVIFIVNLIGVVIFGGFVLGAIGTDIISYTVLLMPALRYLEIVNGSKTS